MKKITSTSPEPATAPGPPPSKNTSKNNCTKAIHIMNSKVIKTDLLLFLVSLISGIVCQAQNKCFKLSAPSAITKIDNQVNKTEFAPFGVHYINFNYSNNSLTLNIPEIGSIKMSSDLIFKEIDKENTFYYVIGDNNPPYTTLQYIKYKKCSFDNPSKSKFALTKDSDYIYVWDEGVMLYTDCNNTTDFADQNLYYTSPEDDLLIKFMRAIGRKAQNSSNSPAFQKPSQSSQSTPTQPQYGEIELKGYVYQWNDWYGKAHDNENSSLTLETRKNHYLGVMHSNNVTNLVPNDKSRTKWSTNKSAFNIKLPKGVKIENSDEIICWEENGNSSNPNYRNQIIFFYTPSTGKIQCLRNNRRQYSGRTLNDVYYFSTYDSNAWSQIKARLMQELPYCADRVY